MINTGLIFERLFAWNLQSTALHCHSLLPLMLLLNSTKCKMYPGIFASSTLVSPIPQILSGGRQ